MARILITTDHVADSVLRPSSGSITQDIALLPTRQRQPVAEVVTLSEVDGIYAIACTGDGVDECPSDLEPGDTWSDLGDCVQNAVTHIGNHEARR